MLKYVQALDANGAAWTTPLVLESGQFNEYSSLAEVNGAPGIAYEDYSGVGALRFAVPVLPPQHHDYLPLLMK